MSTRQDALTAVARIRAASGQVRAGRGGDDLLDDGITTPIRLAHADYSAAELMVRRLGNRHGCKPRSDPGNCPDPGAHAADMTDIARVWAALTEVQPRARHHTGLGLRTNASKRRSKPSTPAS